MYIENKPIKHSYEHNRRKAFLLHGISESNPKFDCHHIVTRDDFNKGLISTNFQINEASNLYPIRKELHVILHQLIDASDENRDIGPYIEKWKTVEANIDNHELCARLLKELPIVSREEYRKLRFRFNVLKVRSPISDPDVQSLDSNEKHDSLKTKNNLLRYKYRYAFARDEELLRFLSGVSA